MNILIYPLLNVLLVFSSQSGIHNEFISENEMYVYAIEQSEPKATAILWVDKKLRDKSERLHVKTVKAKVNISSNGKVEIISFLKAQPVNVERHIRRHVKDINAKSMIDNGYLKPGQQYVQLRYMPGKVTF